MEEQKKVSFSIPLRLYTILKNKTMQENSLRFILHIYQKTSISQQ